MARLAFMLSGWIVWAAHFLGLYAIASLADILPRQAPAWRLAGLGFSLACLLAALAILAAAVRRLRRRPGPAANFVDELAALGGGLAALAIVWQALPALIAA